MPPLQAINCVSPLSRSVSSLSPCTFLQVALSPATSTFHFNSFAEGRQKRDVPNWAMSSSDFFGWVEELRKHAGYDQIQDLARTFWAHFPSADRLGYRAHEPDE
uniref:Uncharacterized protein n=1 Tax=Monopterus albus TaxID=43700 RepID=A0A3Q3IA08_MONAL